MKVLLRFSYDGSKFNGFQRQKNVRSVQKDLEDALSSIYKEDIVIKGAGRTDALVHAINQYAHFDTTKNISNVKRLLNSNLSDIKIKSVKKVNDDFHARFSVKKKVYLYKITNNKLDNLNYYAYYKNLDYKKIKECLKLFVGDHNFKNFVAGSRDNYEGTIFSIKTYKLFNKIYIKFTGHGFYRYMVRNIVGASIDYSQGKVSIKDISNMLNKPLIERQLSTAKREGLYLKDVKY